ncbi:histidine kinase [Mycetocola tolaasinivorans]|uniref:histidine kinase n=1 Tax=Mycetocola tolaasinivorans TaxID=76635 RepID=A0A3L7ABR8_9MICO|nr:ATP-binding protein [Mycetocola tolaasinivorans]RLP77793.1 histidine kinase [Mycetocola tolaasinivorans]
MSRPNSSTRAPGGAATASHPVKTTAPRRLTMLLVQTGIVFVCVGITVVVALIVQDRQIRAATEERVIRVAESLSNLPAVRAGIVAPWPTDELQPVADLVAEAAGMDYVVITDTAGIRLTHPNAARVGEEVSTDHRRVLAGESYVGIEVGTLGPTLRAKMPVYDTSGEIIGTASVGILESAIAEDMHTGVAGLIPWALGSLAVGIGAAALVTMLLGRRLDRLARDSRELVLQRRVSAALGEQQHEFANRLHVLYGLLEDRENDEALGYIRTLVPVDAEAELARNTAPIPVTRTGLQNLLDEQRGRLRAGGGRLEVEGDAGSRVAGSTPDIDTDEFAVIANLLSNAVDAAGPAGTVALRLTRTAEGLSISVTDDGSGIDVSAYGRIFEHGYSTKPRRTLEDGDLPRGYGLALVARVLEHRAGWVRVGVAPGVPHGTRMEAFVPPLTMAADTSGVPR